jgi:hypothetical protein
MLRRAFVLLLVPALAGAAEVVKKYEFRAPQIRDETIYLPGCRPAFIPFAPDMPVKSVVLLLPYGRKAVSYRVTYGVPVELAGTFSIRPFRPGGRLSAPPPADYLLRTSAAYCRNDYFPSTAQPMAFSMQYKNGQPLFISKINPVRYNPMTGKIRYYPTITVAVTTAAAAMPAYKANPLIRGRIAEFIDNKEAAAKLADSPVSADDYEYLIVTTDALKNCFGAFIDFNRRRCLRTGVATIGNIRAQMTGADDQEKIRNYIKQEYIERNIVYVLLAGDAEPSSPNRVPHRGMRAAAHDYGDTVNPQNFYDEHDIPADMYYSCLDGTWRNSGSSYYGEPGAEDLTFEVYAARFPVDDAAELSNMIQKTIGYSEHPVESGVRNALLAGEFLWGPPAHPMECYGDFEMEQLVGTCTANNYTTAGFPADWTFTKLYARSGSWSSTDFINAVRNSGAAWINHEGHGLRNKAFDCYDDQVTTENFPQNGTNANYFFAYSGACYSGAFDNRNDDGSYSSDCIGETFATLPTGAVAVLFNSRYGFADDGANGSSGTDGSNQRLRRYFHDAMFSKGIHYLEMMNAYAKEANAGIILDPDINRPPYCGQLKWCAYETNVLGDPALSLWTEAPAVLAPSLPPTLTTGHFSLRTPPYSWVALADAAGVILCTQLTDSAGNCSIQNDALSNYLQVNPQGRLKVLIKAHNFYPYSGEVSLDIPAGVPGTDGDRLGLRVVLVRTGNVYTLKYRLPSSENVRVEIFDSRGLLVRRAVNERQNAGEHAALFDDSGFHNGLYFFRITAGNHRQGGKFVAVK